MLKWRFGEFPDLKLNFLRKKGFFMIILFDYPEKAGYFNNFYKVEATIMDEEMTFKAIGENGEEIECEVLLTFESEETGKSYIVYTDNSLDDDGNVTVYASTYDPDADETRLYPIETEQEWAVIEKLLNQLQEDPDSLDDLM